MNKLPLSLDPFVAKHKKKYLALYYALREAISTGRLNHGDYVPSTRELSQQLGWSRGTVSLAYEMLWADSYLESIPGKGTRVSFVLDHPKPKKSLEGSFPLSSWGKRLHSSTSIPKIPKAQKIHFYLGYPDAVNFPLQAWQSCARQAIKHSKIILDQEPLPAAGLLALRDGIAKHLRRSQGLDTSASEIVIVNGASQAIGILLNLILNPGDSLVVEEPTFAGIHRLAKLQNVKLIPAPVDAEGIRVENWNARLAFVTPGHQFPTGAVLARDRRLELLRWASKRSALIIEDYIDGEFRRKGRPIESLKLLDRAERVIYLGSFSRTLSRNLRLGFAVLPKKLASLFVEAKKVYEPFSSSPLDQETMAIFLNSGEYEKHLRRMSRIYNRKQQLFFEQIERELSGAFNWMESDVGLYSYASWNCSRASFKRFEKLCAAKGVFWQNPEKTFHNQAPLAAVFGFSHLDEKSIQSGIKHMGLAYRQL